MGIGIRAFQEGDTLAGYTMENIEAHTMGIIQYAGVLRWDDVTVYPIGTYLKATGVGMVTICDVNEADFKVIGNDGEYISFLRILNPIM